MQKKIIKSWHVLVSFALLGALGLTAISCGGDEEPKAKAATADFTFVVNPDKSGSVVFTNTTQNGQSYSWKFDECSTSSTDDSPTHVYAASGTYTVELTALGDAGTDPSVITKDVVVVVDEVAVPNLLEGGTFKITDASKWTIVGTGADMLPNVEFGYTCGVPEGGAGGGLRISNPETAFAGKKVEMVMYRSIALEAGKTYTISALIKHGPLTATSVADGGPKEAFLSFEILNSAPSGTGNWDAAVLLQRYCVCWMGASLVETDGAWLNAYTASWINYKSGDAAVLDFTVATSGTYYVGFKAGLGIATGATFSSDGFVVDNVVIKEKL